MTVLATVAVLATESVRYTWGPHLWWPIFPLFWLLFWVGVVVFFASSRRRWYRHGGHHGHAGENVLAERFARGEINEQEYRERLDVLKRVRAAESS